MKHADKHVWKKRNKSHKTSISKWYINNRKKKHIADILAKDFIENSNQINPKFPKNKNKMQKKSKKNSKTYNKPITLTELTNSIKNPIT